MHRLHANEYCKLAAYMYVRYTGTFYSWTTLVVLLYKGELVNHLNTSCAHVL